MSLRGALRKNPTEAKLLAASLPWRKSLFAAFLCSNVQAAVTRTCAFFFKGVLCKSREKKLVRCFRKGGVLNPVRKKACPRAGADRRPRGRPRSRLARAGGQAWAALCRAASRPRWANQQKRCATHNDFTNLHYSERLHRALRSLPRVSLCPPYRVQAARAAPGPPACEQTARPPAKRSRAQRGSSSSYLTR